MDYFCFTIAVVSTLYFFYSLHKISKNNYGYEQWKKGFDEADKIYKAHAGKMNDIHNNHYDKLKTDYLDYLKSQENSINNLSKILNNFKDLN